MMITLLWKKKAIKDTPRSPQTVLFLRQDMYQGDPYFSVANAPLSLLLLLSPHNVSGDLTADLEECVESETLDASVWGGGGASWRSSASRVGEFLDWSTQLVTSRVEHRELLTLATSLQVLDVDGSPCLVWVAGVDGVGLAGSEGWVEDGDGW